MTITDRYRNFELPWEADPREQRRFRVMLLAGLALVVCIGGLLPLIEVPPLRTAEEAVPPRLARIMEQELPKPPPPKPVELPKPPEAVRKPVPQPVDPRLKMQQSASMRAIRDQLADLRDQVNVASLQTRNLTSTVHADTRAERSIIASKVGTGSAGLASTPASRGFGGGAGALTGHDTTAVHSGIGASTAAAKVDRTGKSGKAARDAEEIELVFDRNKGAIYALYNRALREHPELMGKLVLELTITPGGDISECRLISSELRDSELEGRIVARVKLFKFAARDVETITVKKTIEFFPQ